MKVTLIFENAVRQFNLTNLCLVPTNGRYEFCYAKTVLNPNFPIGNAVSELTLRAPNLTPLMSIIFADEDESFYRVVDDRLVHRDPAGDILSAVSFLPIDDFDYGNGYVEFDMRDVVNLLNNFNENLANKGLSK